MKSNMPIREPDRVYGLTATTNFKDELSAEGVMDVIESCPFKGSDDPLFPFLILEAKSEKCNDGFHDVINQTALPILALLQLQAALRTRVGAKGEVEPLVWFFANRGDSWRVYACYVVDEVDGNPVPVHYVRTPLLLCGF